MLQSLRQAKPLILRGQQPGHQILRPLTNVHPVQVVRFVPAFNSRFVNLLAEDAVEGEFSVEHEE